MTDRELKKLSRVELMEMLLEVTRENEQLRTELAATREELDSKLIAVESAGSLAEASLRLNGVFEAAQKACEQYARNIQARTKQACDRMKEETQEKCRILVQQSKQEADAYWAEIRRKAGSLTPEQNGPTRHDQQETT